MKFKKPTLKTHFESPLGTMLLAASDHGLQGAWFVHGQRHLPDSRDWVDASDNRFLRQAQQQLSEYFSGAAVRFTIPLDLEGGTDFQQTVWRALLQIPRGATTSYGALSREIGNPKAVRALGGAVGHNPISIIVPCHRVLGSDGSLTGYAGGLERKLALLNLEQSH
jgi:methylated-DNA-[protein]-cysteine S-methyltransferase